MENKNKKKISKIKIKRKLTLIAKSKAIDIKYMRINFCFVKVGFSHCTIRTEPFVCIYMCLLLRNRQKKENITKTKENKTDKELFCIIKNVCD